MSHSLADENEGRSKGRHAKEPVTLYVGPDDIERAALSAEVVDAALAELMRVRDELVTASRRSGQS
jgi:hypothetical protein